MYSARLFVLLIPLVGTARSMIVQVNDMMSSTRFYVGPNSHQQMHIDGIDGKSFRVVKDEKEFIEDSSASNGVEKIIHGADAFPIESLLKGRPGFLVAEGSNGGAAIPMKKILKGRAGMIVADGSPEEVNDRVDKVEAKVEEVAGRVDKMKMWAGFYLLMRLVVGLIGPAITVTAV